MPTTRLQPPSRWPIPGRPDHGALKVSPLLGTTTLQVADKDWAPFVSVPHRGLARGPGRSATPKGPDGRAFLGLSGPRVGHVGQSQRASRAVAVSFPRVSVVFSASVFCQQNRREGWG